MISFLSVFHFRLNGKSYRNNNTFNSIAQVFSSALKLQRGWNEVWAAGGGFH